MYRCSKIMIALSVQDSMITTMESFLNEYDAFNCPVSTVTAFHHHQPSKSYSNFNIYNKPLLVNGEPLHYYMATQSYTIRFTLTESPVLSMPIALSKDSLPISIQVVGKRYEDFKLLKVGKALDEFSKHYSYSIESISSF